MPIQFYLNRETTPRTITAPADLTVLQYLRGSGLCGSKEGCASGDCGACTAVLAQVDSSDGSGKNLRYTPFNSCITFLTALHGKLLITVEGLADSDDDPHPVQAAMIHAHGSQCGFCTPGFIMSLFAMHKHPPPNNNEHNVIDAIAGNLCRCTGYRPIIRAGRALLHTPPPPDHYAKHEADIITRLQKIPPPESAPATGTAGGATADSAHIADSAATLAALKQQQPTARLLAGGTDLALEVTIADNTLPATIDLSRIQTLRRIEDNTDSWTLGAGVTIAECMEFFTTRLPQLTPFLKRFGSAPIRARATIGGNIGNASPIADLPPVLIALGASIILAKYSDDGGDGGTRTLPLEEYYLDYKKTVLKDNEWIDAVVIPRPADNALFKIFKISKRIEDDISAVAAACLWEIDADSNTIHNTRLAFGGMAATPKRARATEQCYTGNPWTQETAAAAATALPQDFDPLTDMRASRDYRLRVAAALLTRAYLETTQPLPRIESLMEENSDAA